VRPAEGSLWSEMRDLDDIPEAFRAEALQVLEEARAAAG
jgi:hypothetical protein